MSDKKNYLKIEKSVFETSGKVGYIASFVIICTFIMSIVNIILYCFVDNYYLTKFLFTGEMKFSRWIEVLYNAFEFPYVRIGFFAVIFLAVGVYRSNFLSSEFKTRK